MQNDQTIVVIGSGPCGAMAARGLARLGLPVVMMESGEDRPTGMLIRLNGRNVYRRALARNLDHESYHVATADPKTAWWTNHNPGGLSNNWTGAVPRFAPEDFDEGARLHDCYRWPVNYQDLVPYYEHVESLLQVSAGAEDVPLLPAARAAYSVRMPADWQGVARAAGSHGQGVTSLPLADGPPWMAVRRPTAFNSYSNCVQPLLRSPNFQLMTGAHVLRLEYSKTSGLVDGVIYRDSRDGEERRIGAAAVVVAGGPLNSTRILFNSSCPTFPDGLGNTHGVLGRYLHDHPKEWWTIALDRPIAAPNPAVYVTRRPHASSAPLLATSWTIGFADTRDKVLSILTRRISAAGVQVFGTTIPNERWYVKPHDSALDRFGMPLLDIHMQYDDEVVCNVVRARGQLLEIMGEAGYRCSLGEIEPQLSPGVSVHYGGTVRMHDNPAYGMLDSWNRLHEIPNVVVVDASSFTTGPEKNPTLTAMALAARAAERLACDLKNGDARNRSPQ